MTGEESARELFAELTASLSRDLEGREDLVSDRTRSLALSLARSLDGAGRP